MFCIQNVVFKFKFQSYKNYLDENVWKKKSQQKKKKKKMNISCKKLSKNTIQRMRKNEKEEMKTKQIKIANVGRNLVPIVVQVQGDNR